ncbi:hypothetical protein ACQRIT_005039 [Beauveria bassiana]
MHTLEFYEKLMDIDAQQAKIHSMPTRVLWQKIFIDSLFEIKSSTESQWYWIIDALDEADAPSELISLTGKINSQTPINILITSRVDMDIKRSLQTSVPKQALHQQEIEPADTKDDMAAHARHELETLPFEPNEISQIVELLVAKSQGIFLWVRFAVEEIQATAHTLQGVYEALEAMPSEMANFFQQILDGMSAMREINKKIAKAILGTTVCSMRPLGTLELQAALHPTFGRLASLDYTIKQVCPHLIKVDQDSGMVQLIHETVREFLLQCQDSEFSVDSIQAHHHLTQICLGVWTEDTFASPISSSLRHPRSVAELNAIHPLLYYSATSWFDHLQNAAIDKPLELAMCDFLRTSVLSWVEVAGLLGDLSLLTAGALGLETLMVQSPLISNANKRLVSGWAVDLVRIAPQYGRNIVSYPFSIHKLLPPFCPVKTQIGSQFGAAGDISIVGAGHKHWDDCLAHITVARDGGLLYDAETCQELRRFSHGERIVALHINSTGECIVTGGLRSMKTWRTMTGEMVSELANPGRSRCLGAAFRPDSKCVVIFTSNDSIAIWDLRQNSATESRLERQSVHGKYRGWPWGVAFDKDATKVSLAYKGWPIEVWHVDRVEIVESVPTRNPLGSCFNPSNNDIYVIDHDSTMIRYDVQAQTTTKIRLDVRVAFFAADTMELLYKIDKYSDMVTGLCFSPDGTKLYDIRASDCNVWIPEVLLVLEWSADGSTLVSIDSSQRFIVSRLKQISTTQWNCERQQDFYPGQSNNGAVRQLLLSPDSTRLLASFREAHSFFDLNTGQETLQTAFDHPENLPFWLQHPHRSEQIICLDLQVARIFSWDTFETLTSTDGIVLDHDLAVEWAEKKVKTLAHLTHDKRSVVVEWSTLERNPVTKCSTWSSLGFDTTAELIQESNNWHHLRLDSVVGVYRNQAVFLDQDLWVCSSPCGKKTGTTRHFYMPMDWLNTSEERLAVMTRSGEFVYAQRGVIVVVKCGMRSNQGLV